MLACADIKAAHVSFIIAIADRSKSLPKGSADNHGVFGHDWRRVQPDLAGRDVGENRLIIVELEINDAILPEAGHRHASFSIQADQPVTWSDIEDSFFLSIGPIRKPTTGELSWRGCTTGAFVFSVHPEQFAGGGVKGDSRSSCSGRGVQNAVNHQWGAFQLVLGAVPEDVSLDAPRHLEIIEV